MGVYTVLNIHNTESVLEELKAWKDKNYTDIVLFGRFQPVHKGHMGLLETLRASGLNVNLVINDKTDGEEGERNPFNPYQRQEMAKMALPWLKDENIRHANVYLGRKGVDVGDDVRKLTAIFETIAPPEKLVFAYFEKDEDRKSYLVDGQIIDNVHYVELVGQPRGKFPVQKITEPMIRAATGEYYPIDAKMFRNAVRESDQICYDYLTPAVANYVYTQMLLAEKNGKPVGLNSVDHSISIRTLKELTHTVSMPKLYSDAPKIIAPRYLHDESDAHKITDPFDFDFDQQQLIAYKKH